MNQKFFCSDFCSRSRILSQPPHIRVNFHFPRSLCHPSHRIFTRLKSFPRPSRYALQSNEIRSMRVSPARRVEKVEMLAVVTLSSTGVTHKLRRKRRRPVCVYAVLVRRFYDSADRIVGFSSGPYFSSPSRSIFTTVNCERSIISLPCHFFYRYAARTVQRCCINALARETYNRRFLDPRNRESRARTEHRQLFPRDEISTIYSRECHDRRDPSTSK